MIISISGAMGAGKDTLARHLIDNHGFIKGSFSASLKDAVSKIFGWERSLLDGETAESRTFREVPDKWWTDKLDLGVQVTPRWALQNFATEVMRDHFHEDIWMLSVERWLTDRADKNVVFSDTRFLNEFSLLHARGAVILGVYRTIPKWLHKFYSQNDDTLVDHFVLETPLMELDFASRTHREVALASAKHTLKSLKVEIHGSEVSYLLWNKYDSVIDNTKTLDNSIEQLEAAVAKHK